jgi:hypothetical protein
MMRAVLIALVVAAGIAQQAPPPPRTGALAPGGTGLIAGQVVDPGSGRSVPGAVVWVLMDDQVLRPESPRVMTDSEGRFAFVNVPSGRYRLRSEKLGYLRGNYGEKSVMSDGRDLEIADGQALTDVVVPIWKLAVIGGTVTDEAGEPVVGVTVRGFTRIVAFGEPRFTPNVNGASGITDDRGMYRISSLVPGEYVVAVPSTVTTFPADVMPDLLSRRDVLGEASAAITELTLLGHANNQRVGGSVIMNGNRAVVPPAPTEDVAATYRTTFFVMATKPGDATVFTLKSGDERSGADISMRPVRAGRVTGRLAFADGTAVGPTAIRVLPAGADLVSLSPGFEAATGMSDAAGRFTLLGVPEGQYFLWVEKRIPVQPGVPSGATSLWWANEPVAVGSLDQSDVSVTLRPAPRITGRIEMRDGTTVRPQEGFELLIEAAGMGGRANLFPDSSGPFSVQIVPGRYVITPGPRDGTWCTAVLFQGRDISDEPVTLGSEDIDVTVVCGDQPTRLSGTVRSDAGGLDGDAMVVAFPTERRFWTGAGLRARRKASAPASATGAFSFVNLPAGEYFVAAIPFGSSDFWQDAQVLEALSRSATRVSFAAGESRTVDVRTVRIR